MLSLCWDSIKINITANFQCFSTHNVGGQITINGQQRNLKRFRRQTAYIMQDHDLHSFITVMEAMHFSANLKVGSEVSQADKKLRVSTSMFDIHLMCKRVVDPIVFNCCR